jgi:beta-aspartyl-peptidase (threonine type)
MWLVVASRNGTPGLEEAGKILRQGGDALDAVEQGTRRVESNAQDDSVGVGGLPNVLGDVEVDASIMDGLTMAAGAVGAMRDCEHPISVARRVMENTDHVLLVGDGANRFAFELGFRPRELRTESALQAWHEALLQVMPQEEIDHIAQRRSLLPVVRKLMGPRLQHGTVNFLALDTHGNIASAVSTSGWPWKYPGRLGDSPIIGAGNFCDNRYGAAACTNYGELAIRCGTARSVVLYMKIGMTVEEACHEAMSDLQPLLLAHGGAMTIMAMDANGRPFGITSSSEEGPFLVLSEASAVPLQSDHMQFSAARVHSH